MLIAIDHGNKQIKTINCEPFTSGLLESNAQLFGKDVLMYKGKYTHPELSAWLLFNGNALVFSKTHREVFKL